MMHDVPVITVVEIEYNFSQHEAEITLMPPGYHYRGRQSVRTRSWNVLSGSKRQGASTCCSKRLGQFVCNYMYNIIRCGDRVFGAVTKRQETRVWKKEMTMMDSLLSATSRPSPSSGISNNSKSKEQWRRVPRDVGTRC